MKWLDQNKKKSQEIDLEFLVRGVNSKGVFCISVVSQDRKNELMKKFKNFGSWIYSIALKSNNSRNLNLHIYEDAKV
jgi:hypothetical protein